MKENAHFSWRNFTTFFLHGSAYFYALQKYAFERFICVFNKYVIPNNTKLLNRVFGKKTKDMQKVLSTNVE